MSSVGLRSSVIACFCTFLAQVLVADDWPMLGRDGTRNAVSPEKNPPTAWDVGEFDQEDGIWRRAAGQNIKWVARLGSMTFGDPVIADGLVWVGTNNYWGDRANSGEDASVLACFRESDGELLYKYVSPRISGSRELDWPSSSLASSPLTEGDRLWFVTNRAEIVCLDIGPPKRNHGPAHEVWKLDMRNELGVFPRGIPMARARLCSVAQYKDHLFVVTGNGAKFASNEVPAPEAPSLVCVRKDDGQLLWQDNSPGVNILDGQWTSPFSRADVIAVYLLPNQIEKLIPQFQKLKPGARIVSHQFAI